MFIYLTQVDQTLLASVRNVFGDGQTTSEPGRMFAQDFGARRLAKDIEIINMVEENLTPAWERCMQNALRAKVAVDDEEAKHNRAHVSNLCCLSLVANGDCNSFDVDGPLETDF
jgi:ubiquitin carboxyl-terminal hydrolase L5